MSDHLAEVNGKSTKKRCNLMQKTEDIYHFLLKNIFSGVGNPNQPYKGSNVKIPHLSKVIPCAE